MTARFAWTKRSLRTGLLGFMLLASAAGKAADGVIEINQASAVAGGVTPGDFPGFPVTLSVSGSYALTSDLTVTGLDTSGISIIAADVTLDLRGFTIQGACPVAGCSAGSGIGVGIAASNQTGTFLRDGRVVGFAGGGAAVGIMSRVDRIRVERNGAAGITIASLTDVVDSTAIQNAGIGIDASGGQVTVRGCTSDGNGRAGIAVGAQALVIDSTARNNLTTPADISFGSGIRVASGSLLRRNIATGNQRYGINVEGSAALVSGNVASQNGLSGIFHTGSGFVLGNTAHGNGGAGISLITTPSTRPPYTQNVTSGNVTSQISGGISLQLNVCGNAPC